MIKPGRYPNAKVCAYGMRKTMSGEPSPVIAFLVQDESGMDHKVFWQGYLTSAKAQQVTVKALATCGMRSPEDIHRFAEGLSSGVLDLDREVNITVELETKGDKTYPRVTWINPPSDGQQTGEINFLVEPEEATRLLAAVDLSGVWEKHASKLAEQKTDIPF